MELQKKKLGKIGFTLNGLWNAETEYDRLCIVQDGAFNSYASRKAVPKGTPLTNTEYWQPYSSLKESIVLDYEQFKTDIINSVDTKINDKIDSDEFNIMLEAKIRKILTNMGITI